ncbi:MAG: extracellular solute-binding protein [Eubacterium sp.]|nr:extracellular solute-binding protein [Eubacterium sp.]
MKIKMLSALLIFALLCTGCSGESVVISHIEQTEISLSWWGNDVRHEYTLAAVEEFERLHPEIKVNCQYSEWSGYQLRTNARMASNTEADVMQINYAWIQQYSPNGDGFYNINDVQDYIDLSNFTEEDLDFGMQNDKLNALPIALNTQTVYINKTIYNSYGLEVPQTWEDFFDAAKVMKGEVYPLSMVSKSMYFCTIAYAEQQTGKQFMTIDGQLMFTPEDIQIMLEFYCRLINEKVMPQPEYFDSLNVAAGQYAGTVAWVSDASSHCNKAIDNGYEIIPANYPALQPSHAAEGWYAKPATMYAISKNTEHPKEAAMLLDFLLNSDEMAVLQGIEKGVPVSASARACLEENEMLTGIQYEAFLKMNEFSEKIAVVSPYLENDDMIKEFQSACNAVLYDKVSAEEQAAEIYEIFRENFSGK